MEAVYVWQVDHIMELENGTQTNNPKNYSNQMQCQVNDLLRLMCSWHRLIC